MELPESGVLRSTGRQQLRRYVIVGGGITGLAAAYRLARGQRRTGVRAQIVVFERERRWGGQLETSRRQGFAIESGAESFLTLPPYAEQLCLELGVELQRPNRGSLGWFIRRGGRLRAVPPALAALAGPPSPGLVLNGLLSLPGWLRMWLEPLLLRQGLNEDEALRPFLSRRVGVEAAQALVEPLVTALSGAGDTSVAAFPEVVEKSRGSLLLSMLAGHRMTSERSPVSGGMGGLVSALANRLASDPAVVLRAGTAVEQVRLRDGRGEVVVDGEALAADAVILALPGPLAAGLVEQADPALAQPLRQLATRSMTTIGLAFAPGAMNLPPNGGGYSYPADEGSGVRYCTWDSARWNNRAPAGSQLLRVFLAGADDRDDDILIRLARTELRRSLGITRPPLFGVVFRRPEAMTCWQPGFRRAQENAARRAWPGLVLAGSAFRAGGVSGCVAEGERAAAAVLERALLV